MTNKAEKERRREIVKGLRQKELAEAIARKPIPDVLLKALFEYLEATVFARVDGKIMTRCDHTLNRSREFLQQAGVPNVEEVCEWFGDYDGYCDCEVAFNVADYWYEHVKNA